MMGNQAQEAGPEELRSLAESFRDIIREYLGLELGYDDAAVQWLEGYVERNRDHLQAEGARYMIGAFLGECVIGAHGGSWAFDPDHGWGVRTIGGVMAFPFAKVHKRFAPDGDGDSLTSFVRVLPLIARDSAKKS